MVETLAPGPGRTQGLAAALRANWLILVLLALVTLVVRGIWFGDPVGDLDEQLYSFIGWHLTQGQLPYVDWWDRKPFGLFALYAFAQELLGPKPIAYQLLAAVFAFAGAGLVFALARDLVDRFSACVAGMLYIALTSAYGSYSGQSEIFFLPLMLGMVWLLRDPAHARFAARARWAMLLGGLALQVKYSVIPQCLVLGGWALWWRWRAHRSVVRLLKDALTYSALGLLPTALAAALYAALGHFDTFWFANFTSFFERLPAPIGRWRSSFWIATMPLMMLLGGGLYAAFRARPPDNWQRYGFYLLWGLSTFATVMLPSTVYLYYFAATCGAAVLAALPLIDQRGPFRFVPAMLLLIANFYILGLPMRHTQALTEHRAADRLAAAIAPHIGKQDHCLWVFDGPTALYRLTGSCVPSRFVYPDHLNNALETPAIGISQTGEVRRILALQPGAIVTADHPLTLQNQSVLGLVRQTLAADYHPVLSVELHRRKITAWVRNASSTGAAGPAAGRMTTGKAPPPR